MIETNALQGLLVGTVDTGEAFILDGVECLLQLTSKFTSALVAPSHAYKCWVATRADSAVTSSTNYDAQLRASVCEKWLRLVIYLVNGVKFAIDLSPGVAIDGRLTKLSIFFESFDFLRLIINMLNHAPRTDMWFATRIYAINIVEVCMSNGSYKILLFDVIITIALLCLWKF